MCTVHFKDWKINSSKRTSSHRAGDLPDLLKPEALLNQILNEEKGYTSLADQLLN